MIHPEQFVQSVVDRFKSLQTVVEVGDTQHPACFELAKCNTTVFFIDTFSDLRFERVQHLSVVGARVYPIRLHSTMFSRSFSPKSVDLTLIRGCFNLAAVAAEINTWFALSKEIVLPHNEFTDHLATVSGVPFQDEGDFWWLKTATV